MFTHYYQQVVCSKMAPTIQSVHNSEVSLFKQLFLGKVKVSLPSSFQRYCMSLRGVPLYVEDTCGSHLYVMTLSPLLLV